MCSGKVFFPNKTEKRSLQRSLQHVLVFPLRKEETNMVSRKVEASVPEGRDLPWDPGQSVFWDSGELRATTAVG